MSLRLPVMAASLALTACATAPKPIGGAPGLQVVSATMPAPTLTDIAPLGEAVGVGPYDTLKIDVFGIPDLSNRTALVDVDGHITFPLVGELNVVGKSANEIASLIASHLRGQFIRDPKVTVQVEPSQNRSVTVYGEVQAPGVFQVQGSWTLMKAIASARGLSQYANSKDVVVLRTVNGQKMAALYNVQAISRGTYEDPRIYPNDVVVVGDSRARRLFDDVVKAATVISSPLILLLQ